MYEGPIQALIDDFRTSHSISGISAAVVTPDPHGPNPVITTFAAGDGVADALALGDARGGSLLVGNSGLAAAQPAIAKWESTRATASPTLCPTGIARQGPAQAASSTAVTWMLTGVRRTSNDG